MIEPSLHFVCSVFLKRSSFVLFSLVVNNFFSLTSDRVWSFVFVTRLIIIGWSHSRRLDSKFSGAKAVYGSSTWFGNACFNHAIESCLLVLFWTPSLFLYHRFLFFVFCFFCNSSGSATSSSSKQILGGDSSILQTLWPLDGEAAVLSLSLNN